jgi:putative addiction module CopG family antidote
MHISLPESLKGYVKERMKEEHYDNSSDYFHALVREDQKRRDGKKLEQMLLHGIASGSHELTPEEWKTLKEEILASARK